MGTPNEPLLEVHELSEPQVIPLTEDVTRVGRSRKAEVHIRDGRVSKNHAEIQREGDGFAIVDTASKTGVFCNHKQVARRALRDGDVITLGPEATFQITYRGPSVQVAAPSSSPDPATDSKAQQSLRTLARFLEMSHELSGGFDAAQILESVVDLAVEMTAAERGMVIVGGADAPFEFHAARGAGGVALDPGQFQFSETIVGQVFAEKKPRVVSDIGEDAELAMAQSIMSLELRSAVVMPLWRYLPAESDDHHARRTDEVFGVLYIDSRQRGQTFDSFDLGILETLARDASSAIENARLLGEAEDRRRMQRELATAREVQASLLPSSYFTDTYFDVAGSCVPCLDLGGDYLDQFRLADGRVAFVVADVCGKGLPAALLAAAVQGALAAEFAGDQPLSITVRHVNRVVCRLAETGNFISMLACTLSPDGELRYVNAGHCPLLVVAGGQAHPLVTGGMALGIIDDAEYEEHVRQLGPGDTAWLYSDGVVEAENERRELFGDERLVAAVCENPGDSADVALRNLLAAVDGFRGSAAVADDITAMAVRYR